MVIGVGRYGQREREEQGESGRAAPIDQLILKL